MTRTLVAAGKIGPAFAKYQADDDTRRRRRIANLPEQRHGRVVTNVDKSLLTDEPHGRGLYYVGTDAYTIGSHAYTAENRTRALRRAIYAALPAHPSHNLIVDAVAPAWARFPIILKKG